MYTFVVIMSLLAGSHEEKYSCKHVLLLGMSSIQAAYSPRVRAPGRIFTLQAPAVKSREGHIL